MANVTTVSFTQATTAIAGVVEGEWATPVSGGTRHSISSIGYPIMAASVSDILDTRSFDLLLGAVAETVLLETALPTLETLVASVNQAVSEAYPAEADPPQMVRQSDGWHWINPTASAFTVTYRNINQQQLYLGNVFSPSSWDIVVAAGGSNGPHFPDPRLGAVSQSLVLHPGQDERIELPLQGKYRDGVLFRPDREVIGLSFPALTAALSVFFPSIGDTVPVTVDRPSIVDIVSRLV